MLADEGKRGAMPEGPIFESAAVSAAFGSDASYLGTGAFGETWRVHNEAVKIMHKDSGARLQREIDGLQRVVQPNVVRLLRTGSVEIDGVDHVALHFDYVAGGDMKDAIEEGRLLPPNDTRAFLQGLLTGVAALHDEGIIHRDLKPANVALRDGDWRSPVILDLGLAKILDLSSLTAYPALVGTAPYMAPEQLSGGRVRRLADIFACGVLTYEAVAGVHPFYAPGTTVTVSELAARIAVGPERTPIANLSLEDQDLLLQMTSPAAHLRGTSRSLVEQLAER
ncbi:MAG: serine/threonine-protein kinase [Nocardioides sp.]